MGRGNVNSWKMFIPNHLVPRSLKMDINCHSKKRQHFFSRYNKKYFSTMHLLNLTELWLHSTDFTSENWQIAADDASAGVGVSSLRSTGAGVRPVRVMFTFWETRTSRLILVTVVQLLKWHQIQCDYLLLYCVEEKVSTIFPLFTTQLLQVPLM